MKLCTLTSPKTTFRNELSDDAALVCNQHIWTHIHIHDTSCAGWWTGMNKRSSNETYFHVFLLVVSIYLLTDHQLLTSYHALIIYLQQARDGTVDVMWVSMELAKSHLWHLLINTRSAACFHWHLDTTFWAISLEVFKNSSKPSLKLS